jgi:hypothetical protein
LSVDAVHIHDRQRNPAPGVVLEKIDPPHVAAEHIDALVAAHLLNFMMLAPVSAALVTKPARRDGRRHWTGLGPVQWRMKQIPCALAWRDAARRRPTSAPDRDADAARLRERLKPSRDVDAVARQVSSFGYDVALMQANAHFQAVGDRLPSVPRVPTGDGRQDLELG